MADLLEHPPDLPVASFDQRYLVPGIGGIFDHLYFGRGSFHPPAILGGDGNSRSKLRDLLFGRFTTHFHQVGLGNVRRCSHEPLCEFAIIGKKQQPFAAVVEPPHGIHPPFHAR